MPWDSSMHNFIWCSHGASVSANDVLFETPIGSFIDVLLFYVPHDELFYLSSFDLLSERKTVETEFGTTRALVINTSEHSENTNVASLPPMVFGAHSEDSTNQIYTNNMGLWYHPQQVPNEPNKPSIQLLGFNDIVQMTSKYKQITYSIIFKHINDYIKKISEDEEYEINEYYQDFVCVHFATCRSTMERYLPEYNLLGSPETKEDPQINALKINPNIFSSTLKNNMNYMFARFKNNNSTILSDIHNFGALAEITHAGCGLNVLSLFKIIHQSFAREQVVCLPLSGQTIFNLVTQLIMFSNLEQSGYTWTIIRYPISQLGVIINALIQSQPNNTTSIHDTFIILKLYETDTYKGRDSHAGHTIALYFTVINNITNIYMMDPQAQQYINITQDTTGAFNNYLLNKHYFDIIFREMPFNKNELWNIPVDKNGIKNDGGRLIVYNSKRYMGGMKTFSKKKIPFKSGITINEFMNNFSKIGGKNKKIKNKYTQQYKHKKSTPRKKKKTKRKRKLKSKSKIKSKPKPRTRTRTKKVLYK